MTTTAQIPTRISQTNHPHRRIIMAVESQQQQMGGGGATMEGEGIPEDDSSARFEDLTVDDDLPIIERVVRYVKSGIALQRLVHVKMLAETAALAGYVLFLFCIV
jgi:hypothetical protein